jgi:hypothetical protein
MGGFVSYEMPSKCSFFMLDFRLECRLLDTCDLHDSRCIVFVNSQHSESMVLSVGRHALIMVHGRFW